MAASFSSTPRLLSPPIEIHWAGFRSDTVHLQQAGWQVAAEEDVMRQRLRVMLRHDGFRIDVCTQWLDYSYFHDGRRLAYNLPPLQVCWAAPHNANLYISEPLNFAQIDAQPQFVQQEPKSIDDLKIFATPLTRTEEIIVEPETVQQLLERIREMQAPEQAKLREKQRLQLARESFEAGPRQQFHAQILSIAA